jgi:CheY-like chemotaxis protein
MPKNVLIVDESPRFRSFLKEKLELHGVLADFAANGLDAIVKLRNDLPDLVILDLDLTGRTTAQDFLAEKSKNPNTVQIPIVATGTEATQKLALESASSGVRKFLPKPIRIDLLYLFLVEQLGISVDIDKTPCSLEASVNDGILFIEAAMGLNRDKIELLGLKLHELIDLYGLEFPRALVMASDLGLSFIDGPNIELFLGTIVRALGGRSKSLKVLTKEPFLVDFIKGRKDYAGIQPFDSLQLALDDLLSDSAEKAGRAAVDFVSSAGGAGGAGRAGSVEIRFDPGKLRDVMERIARDREGTPIAIVDDDAIIRELIKVAFQDLKTEVREYANGKDFMDAVAGVRFSLVFLDIMMPEMNGFEVLEALKRQENRTPVIVLSALSRKEAVMKAVQLGVKSYMVKPIKPDAVFRKALEILSPSF